MSVLKRVLLSLLCIVGVSWVLVTDAAAQWTFGLDNVSINGANAFTETFDTGHSNWLDVAEMLLDYNATGGNPGGYIADTPAMFDSGGTIFRGHDNFMSSGNAFVGDWVADGVTTLSFDVLHDSPVDMTFLARIATSSGFSTNFPAFIAFNPVPVSAGSWSTVTLNVTNTSPFLINEGAGVGATHATVFSNVLKIQILAEPVPEPTGLAGALGSLIALVIGARTRTLKS